MNSLLVLAALAQPVVVNIGVYLVDISQVDLKMGTAEVTLYVWTRWEGDPEVGTQYELINGTVEAKDHEYRTEANGFHYAYYKMRATVKVDFDLHAFPYDRHELRLDFEHAALLSHEVVFAVDEASMAELGSPSVVGWEIGDPRYRVSETTYRTSFGMPDVPLDEFGSYSRFTVTMELRHGGDLMTFLKTFLALFISVLIALLGFLIHPEELEARMGAGVAGVFGVVTSHLMVSGNLPEISYLTLSDKLHLAGLFVVFLAILDYCFAGYLVRADRPALARRLDRRVALGLVAGYVGLAVASIAMT
jgi:hypothetical protein